MGIKYLGYCVLIFASYTSCSSMAKKSKCNQESLIENIKTLDLKVYMASCNNCAPIRNEGYRVGLTPNNFDDNINAVDTLVSLDFSCWVMLLNDESTNWQTNLLLYHLYQRDALLLAGMTEQEWQNSSLKSQDIEYWSNFLSP